jgi:hypothetical protein
MFQTEFRDAAIDATWDMRQGHGDRSLVQTTVRQWIMICRSEWMILQRMQDDGSYGPSLVTALIASAGREQLMIVAFQSTECRTLKEGPSTIEVAFL